MTTIQLKEEDREQEQEQNKIYHSNILVFTIIWFGQLVSVVGSSLTSFGLGVWMFQNSGSVTQYALITICATLPPILMSPIAGSLVDRWSKRWIMILSDCGSGLCTLVIAILFWTDHLQVWHIYLSITISSTLSTFQWPAYRTATTLIIPQDQLTRANSMIQIGVAGSQLISPFLAGLLLVTTGLKGIFLIDIATFSFAFLTLISMRFREIETKTDKKLELNTLIAEFMCGWNYVAARKGLLGLLFLFAMTNFLLGFASVLLTPLVLPLFSPAVFGTLDSIGGIGAVLSSLIMIVWQAPRGNSQFHINSIFGGLTVMGFCLIGTGWNNSFWGLATLNFLFLFCLPIVNTSDSVIWQKKIPLDIQGRVFALKQMVLNSCMPLAAAIAGPINEYVFLPLKSNNGFLDKSIRQFIDMIPGNSINLFFIFSGSLFVLLVLIAYQYPRLRLIEDEIPDVIFNSPLESDSV
jgi:MFS family permease